MFNPTEESKKIVWKLFDFMHIAPEENCCTALFYPKLCKPAQQMKDEQQATKNYIDSLCTYVKESPSTVENGSQS